MSLAEGIDRRTLLIGGGVGIGLVVAFALWPEPRRRPSAGALPLGSAIAIDPRGTVSIAVPQIETGQGIWTALAQIAADELGAAWTDVAVVPARFGDNDSNPFADRWLARLGTLTALKLEWTGGQRITAGSTSIRGFAGPVRQAAAAARHMLIAAAAERWGADAADCSASDGIVRTAGRSLSFADLAEDAARHAPPRSPALRRDHPLLGQSLPRLDGPAKANGRWRFASDVRLPDMLYASARIAPPGGRIARFDDGRARAQPGVIHAAHERQWVAVVASDWASAERALDGAGFVIASPPNSVEPGAALGQALATGDFTTIADHGSFADEAATIRPIAATYGIAPSAHLSIDPVSATARPGHNGPELWVGSQAPGLMQRVAGFDTALYPMPVGNPAGAAMDNPAAAIALALADQLQRPVQVTLPHHVARSIGPIGSGALVHMEALVDRHRQLTGWSMTMAAADGLDSTLARLAATDRPSQAAALADMTIAPYGVANVRVRSCAADLPFQCGYMRGSPEREAVFASESFIDELARRLGQEPLAFRMGLLGGNPRLARCFQAAAGMAAWDGGGPGSAMGIAGASAFGSHIALVATASIGPDQGIAVERLDAAVDCGPVVNSGLAAQQVEGALLWALAQATQPPLQFRAGMTLAGPTTLPTIAGTPDIAVRFLPGSTVAGGLSGLGTLPLAPAIANALHAATGRRMRNLPFDPMAAR